MAQIVSGNLYRIRCMLGGVVQPALMVLADDKEQACQTALAHLAELPDSDGKPVSVLATTEIDLGSL